ncbi:MAG: DinB family protein [Pyrinomonadaceae bacterium]
MRKAQSMFFHLLLVAILMQGVFSVAAKANPLPQAQAKKTATPSEALLRSWNNAGRQLIEMAEDFPQDKYNFKPKPEVRTFAQQLLHVAGGNYYYMSLARGVKAEDEDPSEAKYKTKAGIVAVLKKSFADGAELIKQTGDTGIINNLGLWIGAVQHAGEHYGQLVVYYRLNGIVPPASRPRPKTS